MERPAGRSWGCSLVTQYEIDGNLATLDEAVDLLSAVVQETPKDPVSGTDYRTGLGLALETRVWATGSMADADAAVALGRSVLADTPGGAVDYLVARSNLANSRSTRHVSVSGAYDRTPPVA